MTWQARALAAAFITAWNTLNSGVDESNMKQGSWDSNKVPTYSTIAEIRGSNDCVR